MIRKRLLILLIALAFVFTGAPVAFAYECDHDWTYYWDDEYCTCSKCGETKPHNSVVNGREPGDCITPETIFWVCLDCGQYRMESGKYGPHEWIGPGWYDKDNSTNKYSYGYICGICDKFKYAPITIKKGKTKRVLSKYMLKYYKVVKVTSNSKKVKAKKNGKVKGKKRGGPVTITWTVKFKAWTGSTAKEKYKAKVIVK